MNSFCFRSPRLSSVSVLEVNTLKLNIRESTEIPSFLAWFCKTPVKKPKKENSCYLKTETNKSSHVNC